MDLKRTLLTIVTCAAVGVPSLAFADHDRHDRRRDDRHRRHDHRNRHQHSAHCGHDHHRASRNVLPPPPPLRRTYGRYEWRTVRQWVAGHYERQWVPEQCVTRHRRRRTVTRCTPGQYQDVWVPGRYQPRAQWVWVASRY